MEPLNPTLSLLGKLGSLAFHAGEMLSHEYHAFDRAAIQSLLDDEEVKQWLKEMDQLALIPLKRN